MSGSTRGRLLVATPPLEDPHFDRSVVFMLEHRDDGAIGVIVNRPDPTVDDAIITAAGGPLHRWNDRLSQPAVVFAGGPVESTALMGIASGVPGDPDDALHVVGDIWSIDLSADPVMTAAGAAGVRIFRGYAGWGGGQLDAELASGAWIVVDATPDDVITDDPATLWRRVLARQHGRIAWLSAAPDDLTMN
ncbi:MAG: YqgE/AlgH family protein [Actinomycetota bacterium]|nr:YqgE/AlgH family protein [Ilumatobacteraceae bacterium]MDA2959704.1 YqgE/AlgH family protein [Actinomycetota bacterium]MDA3007380.1 YqgE/AlgH family protein [Actinomycetota bacterium]MDA3034798.1 YqgE/AlgH family protein [Actinomycetota bacterium]